MAVAVGVDPLQPAQLQPGFRVPFGVELDQLDPFVGHPGQEGDEVPLCHGVVQGDVDLVLHRLQGDGVVFVGGLGFQRGQG